MTTWNITPTSTPTLAQACAGAAPGDTVSLTGRFSATALVPQTSGTAGNPIIYKASSPGAAIFDSAGMSAVLLNVGGARSYLTFDGIAFTNSAYQTKPVANKGMLLRGNHHIVQNCVMNYMQMQLIGASSCTIQNNTWREFVASYFNGAPQTLGDMLNLGSTSHDNIVTGNDMKYAGHSLIAVGDGITGTTNANNHIYDNTLDNPWYKCLILADNGTGCVIEENRLLNANSVAFLLSTVHSGLSFAEATVQFSGSNFVLRNNLIDGAVGQYGLFGLGARYYTGVTPHVLVESKNNEIYGNTIQNCQGAAVVSFEQNYVPGTDATVPAISGNLIHDNIVVSMSPPTPRSDGLIHSWDGTTHYEPIMLRSFQGATPWVGLNTNAVHDNWGFSSTNAWRSSYVNSAGATTTTVKTLAQFNGFDANIYSNSASQPPVAPTANFSLSVSTGLAPLDVTFTDTSTGTPTSWAWDFGDAGTSTSQSPSHTFATPGLYTVTLTATNSGGSTTHNATVTVTAVPPVPPTADFTYALTSGTLTVTFTDASTGTPTSWLWDFGDGTTSTSQSPSHTFATSGAFTATLTATNANGSTTRTQAITIPAVTPPFVIVVPPSGLSGSANANALIPAGSPAVPEPDPERERERVVA